MDFAIVVKLLLCFALLFTYPVMLLLFHLRVVRGFLDCGEVVDVIRASLHLSCYVVVVPF